MNKRILMTLIVSLSIFNLSAKDKTKSTIPIPTKTVLTSDLIGRQLSEGTDNGYFPSDWLWTIEEGQISDFKIITKKVESDYCSFNVIMKLKTRSCPTKYTAVVQMDYMLKNNRWHISMVSSKGVSVVKTNRYNKCIVTKVEDDGWGGVDCLKIKNNTDTPLIVGGEFLTNYPTQWNKFSVVVPGLKVMSVGGVFGGGNVVDFRIHFVEPY